MGASNVTVGKPKVGGALSYAPIGTALPTDASTALNVAFINCGYISEDGLTQATTRDSESIKAWGGDTVLVTQTDYAETYSCTLIETLEEDVKKLVFGSANVTGTLATGITAISNSKELSAFEFVIDMVQNGNLCRKVIPNGKITEIGEINYSDSEAVGYEITITALPDSSNNVAYEYTVTPA